MTITEVLPPLFHKSFQLFDFRYMVGTAGEVVLLVRVGFEIKQESMVDLRVNVKLPPAVVDCALIVLKREEH